MDSLYSRALISSGYCLEVQGENLLQASLRLIILWAVWHADVLSLLMLSVFLTMGRSPRHYSPTSEFDTFSPTQLSRKSKICHFLNARCIWSCGSNAPVAGV